MKKVNIAILSIILLSFILATYLYPRMPEQMASHWNARGEVNGYMSKFWGLFLMPLISVLMFLLFIFIPNIDPLKKNIEKFREYYETFIFLLVAFLFYLYILTLFWNLNFRFNMTSMIVPAFGFFFYYIGVLLKHAKRNWFIGIRTPWTLSNDKVWNKTHELGSKAYQTCAVISLIGIFTGEYAIFFIIVPILAVSIYLVIYSYIEYRKEKK
ncbi:SdpI family protein [Candidatus Woesearchaeota archaeon]|nr:SdpI family protein [Candidatus Woesearchaeota archaeon]